MADEEITHFCHEHPLILTENLGSREPNLDCFACKKPIDSELAYVCVKYQYCVSKSCSILHKKCADLPTQISHRQHALHIYQDQDVKPYRCNLCRANFRQVLRYRCHSCDFNIDITCKRLGLDELFEGKSLAHPSHVHPLRLMRKPEFAFCCDGCGVEDRDMAYACSSCELLIHKACALLPASLPTDLHHHHLSLAFSFPIEHRKHDFRCDVCNEYCNVACWVYYCGDCRYFAHLSCAMSTAHTTERDSNIDDHRTLDCEVMMFPLDARHMSEELIKPFVIREEGLNKIPDVNEMPTTVNLSMTTASFSFLFNYHKHPLSLVSESHQDEGRHNEIVDEDEDEHELKICNMCVTPISSPPYYECSPCKYYVHSICYLLPKTLSSSSSSSSLDPHLRGNCTVTHDKNHKFTLYTSSESFDRDDELYNCELCCFPTNGMVYECEGCEMKIDVKCASLPTAIRHASHHHHNLTRIPPKEGGTRNCRGCGQQIRLENNIAYCCSSDGCDFALDLGCALLPQSIHNEWDRHPLLLTYDAYLGHPSDFVCEVCQDEMNPKNWMYHCRECDNSFHPFCFKTESGEYRNIKFGRQFVLRGIHPHPLVFSCVTLKKLCDICNVGVYDKTGLECATCNYVVCLICACKELAICNGM